MITKFLSVLLVFPLLVSCGPGKDRVPESSDRAIVTDSKDEYVPRWTEDFESNASKLSPMTWSSAFRRSREESVSGYFSLVVEAPLKGEVTGQIVGGDMVRVDLPRENHDIYSITLKTWLKKLDVGRLTLRASFFDTTGRRLNTVELGNILIVEEGWTEHRFSRPLTTDGIKADHLTFYAALDSEDALRPASGLAYFEDITFDFERKLNIDRSPLWEGFESEIPAPLDFKRSPVFFRTNDEALSGGFSLCVEAPLEVHPDRRFVGGEIARVEIPDDMLFYRISVNTWVRELNIGRLMLRTSFLDAAGTRKKTVFMNDLRMETGWTKHQFDKPLHEGGEGAQTMGLYVALDSESGLPSSGRAYIDDIEFEFYGKKADPYHLLLDFETVGSLPQHLQRSRIFSCEKVPAAASGEHSLVLSAPLPGKPDSRFVGGNIAELEIQPDKSLLRISIKTRLEKLESGRLMLRAAFHDAEGNKMHGLVLGDITELGKGWEHHDFNYPLRQAGLAASTVSIYVALDSESESGVNGMAYFDDVELLLYGPEPDPNTLNLNFESRFSVPAHLEYSNALTRTQNESASGEYSMLLASTPANGGSFPAVVGEELARMRIPEGQEIFRIRIKTWLKELESGSLMIRGSYFDEGGNKLKGIALDDIIEVEDGWTTHQYENLIDHMEGKTRSMAVYLGLNSGSSSPVQGRVYLDDLGMEFARLQHDPYDYLQDFDVLYTIPTRLRDSGIMIRTSAESISGDHSMVIRSPLANGTERSIVGDVIAKMEVPANRDIYVISMNTWLKQLESGRLMLRALFRDEEGVKLKTFTLADITELEGGWLNQRFERSLGEDDVYSAKSLSLYMALDSQADTPVIGEVYFDDVRIQFHP